MAHVSDSPGETDQDFHQVFISIALDSHREMATLTPLTAKFFNLNFHPLEVVSR